MTQQQAILSWLKDAHAMEVGAISTLSDHASAADHYPELQAKLNAHIEVTHRHAELVASCIERLGGHPSVLKEAVGGVLGRVTGLTNVPAKDTVIKNALGDFAAENFEIICYQSLVAAAEQLGDHETASTCRQILRDEQAMAAWLTTNITSLTQRFLTTQADEDNAPAGRVKEAVGLSDNSQDASTKTGTRTALLASGALLAGAGAALLIGQALKGSSKDENEALPEQYSSGPGDTADGLAAMSLTEERIAVEALNDEPAEVTTDLLAVEPSGADLLNQNDESALMTELLSGGIDGSTVATDVWLAPGPYTGMGPKAYDSAGDPSGQEAALRLTQHGQVDASNIEVTVDDSEVLLEGTVGSEEAKRLAEEAVRSLSGVKNVQNLLQVHV